MSTNRIIYLTSRNIFTNLAAEERLFSQTAGRTLLFYINTPSVVVGRTQNPYHELDVAHAAQQNMAVARRRSGGGTVVHDLGNLNMSFIDPRATHDSRANAETVATVLKEFGVPAEVSARGDVLANGKKISGSAYRLSRDRAYHHATLLLNSDLDLLRRVLRAPLASRLTVKGAASVPASVTNVSEFAEVQPQDFMRKLGFRLFGPEAGDVIEMTANMVNEEVGGMSEERAELCSGQWVFGQTPMFSCEVQTEGTVVKLSMKKGMVVEGVEVRAVDATTDAKAISALATRLQAALVGCVFDGPSLETALAAGEFDGSVDEVTDAILKDVAQHHWIG